MERAQASLAQAERAQMIEINNALDTAAIFLRYGIRNQIERIVLDDTLATLSTHPQHAAVVNQLKGLQ